MQKPINAIFMRGLHHIQSLAIEMEATGVIITVDNYALTSCLANEIICEGQGIN